MCGRYTLTQSPKQIKGIQLSLEDMEFEGKYNIAPSQSNYVIPSGKPYSIHSYRWGLIPHWAKDMSIAYKLINARVESVADKPSFRTAVRHGRCLVPADGFYEWKKLGKSRQAYRITMRDDSIFCFAGISTSWLSPNNEKIYSYSVITTEPNELMAPIHNRMPAILSISDYEKWLDDKLDVMEAISLCKPFPSEEMKAYMVSPRVGNVRNHDADLIQEWQAPDELF